tara:strand:+ start:5426 stop:5791 length:366 start_codon:yes stop_codon:yes gene_type:complete
MDLSPEEFTRQAREEALRKYQDEQQKFSLQMMTMGYYKIKSLLSQSGLEKVEAIDLRRNDDQEFNKNFSEKIWNITEEAWSAALGQLIIKISDTYGLKLGVDIRVDLPSEDENENNLDFYV